MSICDKHVQPRRHAQCDAVVGLEGVEVCHDNDIKNRSEQDTSNPIGQRPNPDTRRRNCNRREVGHVKTVLPTRCREGALRIATFMRSRLLCWMTQLGKGRVYTSEYLGF